MSKVLNSILKRNQREKYTEAASGGTKNLGEETENGFRMCHPRRRLKSASPPSPKDICVQIPQTCECHLIWGKRGGEGSLQV